MKTIQVYDPAMCCNTGVCGTEVDQQLVNFAVDVNWAKQQGVQIQRFNLAHQPMDFVNNEVVRNFLERSGDEALPLILVDGEVALASRYPHRTEIARWAGLTKPAIEIQQAASSCCSGSKCC